MPFADGIKNPSQIQFEFKQAWPEKIGAHRVRHPSLCAFKIDRI
jgi:hypothetical protein